MTDAIENDVTLGIVRKQVDELKAWRDRVLHEPGRDPFMLHITVAGIEKKIAHLEREIGEYEQARSSAGN